MRACSIFIQYGANLQLIFTLLLRLHISGVCSTGIESQSNNTGKAINVGIIYLKINHL